MAIVIRRNPERRLTLFEPYHPLSLLDEFETLRSSLFDGGRLFPHTGLLHSLDVYREKDDLVVKAELPGIDKNDLEVSLEDDVLIIKAEKKQEKVTEDASYYAAERQFGQYTRTIALPFEVDSEKITTKFENGVLELRLPKAEETKTKRIKVDVK